MSIDGVGTVAEGFAALLVGQRHFGLGDGQTRGGLLDHGIG